MHVAEQWLSAVGWEAYYEVSSLGRVRSCPRVIFQLNRWGGLSRKDAPGLLLKSRLNTQGYLRVNLSKEGSARAVNIHQLVCEAFHGPATGGKQVAHEDGDRSNARAENLRWATPKDNAADKRRHGTFPSGEINGNSKVGWDEVSVIRTLTGVSQREIARRFAISPSQVRNIQKGTSWNPASV